jgi:hypothetical protein
MSEIEVVVDVKESPEAGGLIVVKRKLVATGDLHMSGSPVETTLGLMTRKATLSLFGYQDAQTAFGLGVRLTNEGPVPFVVEKVAFECVAEPQEHAATNGIKTADDCQSSWEMVPRSSGLAGPLHPGESREYVLPRAFALEVSRIGDTIPPDHFWVAAYSGRQQLARVVGDRVRRFLVRVPQGINRRAQPLFDTLPVARRLEVLTTIAALEARDPESWPTLLPGKVKLLASLPGVYVVLVPPELALLVMQTQAKQLEVVDIVRTDALEALTSRAGSEGAAG